MPLLHLQHFLIQTTDLAGTAKWYVDVLGLREGPHPDFKFPVVWLYLDHRALSWNRYCGSNLKHKDLVLLSGWIAGRA